MNDNIEKVSVPQDTEAPEAPTTAENSADVVIPVKYNKEVMNLSIERAGELAQKGMKFEALTNEWELLKQLATDSGKTVMQFLNSVKAEKQNSTVNSLIEKCGDDTFLANEVLRVFEQNGGKENADFSELQESFPEIKSIDDLPESVLENAKLCGRPLLDEYLRYRLGQEKAVKENLLSQQRGKATTAGSQLNKSRGDNPEAAEFLKGLWRK